MNAKTKKGKKRREKEPIIVNRDPPETRLERDVPLEQRGNTHTLVYNKETRRLDFLDKDGRILTPYEGCSDGRCLSFGNVSPSKADEWRILVFVQKGRAYDQFYFPDPENCKKWRCVAK